MSKIVFVYYPWETLGGAITRVMNMLQALENHSFEINLLILSPKNIHVLTLLRKMLEKNSCDTTKITTYLMPLRIIKKPREENLWANMFMRVFVQLAKFLIREGGRKQVILYSRPPFYIMAASTVAAKLFRIKSVSEIHHHLYADYKNMIFRFFLKILEFMILHLSDLIVVNSRTFSNSLSVNLKVNLSKIAVVDNCILPTNLEISNRETSEICKNTNLIGFAGSLKPEEDLITLFKAFKMVLQEKADATLVIIGGGLMERYKKLADKMEIKERVIFLGEKSHEETLRIMKKMKVFVAPRIRSEKTETAAPIKIIEALALGIPLVSTDLPPIREITGDAAILTPPQDFQSLATAIKRLLNDETLRQNLINKGKKRALNYGCDRTILPLVSKLKGYSTR